MGLSTQPAPADKALSKQTSLQQQLEPGVQAAAGQPTRRHAALASVGAVGWDTDRALILPGINCRENCVSGACVGGTWRLRPATSRFTEKLGLGLGPTEGKRAARGS